MLIFNAPIIQWQILNFEMGGSSQYAINMLRVLAKGGGGWQAQGTGSDFRHAPDSVQISH